MSKHLQTTVPRQCTPVLIFFKLSSTPVRQCNISQFLKSRVQPLTVELLTHWQCCILWDIFQWTEASLWKVPSFVSKKEKKERRKNPLLLKKGKKKQHKIIELLNTVHKGCCVDTSRRSADEKLLQVIKMLCLGRWSTVDN